MYKIYLYIAILTDLICIYMFMLYKVLATSYFFIKDIVFRLRQSSYILYFHLTLYLFLIIILYHEIISPLYIKENIILKVYLYFFISPVFFFSFFTNSLSSKVFIDYCLKNFCKLLYSNL